MSILQKLYRIQQGAVSPKDKDNSFAGFKYRNVEGILRNCKPLFRKEQVYCKLSDEVVEVNGQAYVKATAILYDCESGENIFATGYAREMESKKGNDSSQCTGSASTYARKYALCGLLGLDDSKAKAVADPDTLAPAEHEEAKDTERQEILMEIYDMDITRKEVDDQIAVYYKGKDADTIELSRLRALLKYYQKTKKAKES